MARVTIDGRTIDVPEGTTILDAARQLNIDIPTLCLVEGLAPLTTCYVCVVQVAGRARLSPSCATPVADGMVVESSSPAVAAARKTAVELLLSDHLGECEAPCEISCPAGLRIPRYMEDLAAGELDAASAIAREDLVLPGVLGLICPRFCERACRRAERDASVAIAALHHRTAERELRTVATPAGGQPANAECEMRNAELKKGTDGQGDSAIRLPNPQSAIKRVAIVGAGPTGLAAAFNLLRRGHGCTLIDERPEPGGMIRYSLDEARVPRPLLAGEVDVIRRMGAEFRMNTRVGRDVTLFALRQEFDAVLLAVGAPTWQRLECAGAELAESAGPLLARLAAGEKEDLEGDVIVVGGGHEAIEAARTAVRHGATSVTVLCPRPADHLPLLAPQIELARKAGVKFMFAVQVREIRKPALRLYVAAVGPSDQPVKVDCNRLLIATGRDVELELLASAGVTTGKRGITVDKATLATNLPGVFAGGDAVSGGGFAVRAIAYGQMAAESIDQFLRGQPVVGKAHPHIVRYGKLSPEERAMLLARTGNPAARSPSVPDDRAARLEAARCLICGCQDNGAGPDASGACVFAKSPAPAPGEHASGQQSTKYCRLRQAATLVQVDASRFKGERRAMERDASHPLIVYESGKCIQCGACVKICEQAPAEPGSAVAAAGGLTYIGRGFNVRVAVPWGGKLADALGASLADLARRCAEACPTSAIVLKRKPDKPKT